MKKKYFFCIARIFSSLIKIIHTIGKIGHIVRMNLIEYQQKNTVAQNILFSVYKYIFFKSETEKNHVIKIEAAGN